MGQWQALARVPVKRYAFTRVSPSLLRATPRWDSVYPGHWSLHELADGEPAMIHRDCYKRVGVDTGERFWMFEKDQELYAAYGKEQALMSREEGTVYCDDDDSDDPDDNADWVAVFAGFTLSVFGIGRHDMDRIDVTLTPSEGTPIEYGEYGERTDIRMLVARRILDARL